jgi:hypothetical protein
MNYTDITALQKYFITCNSYPVKLLSNLDLTFDIHVTHAHLYLVNDASMIVRS